MITLTTPMWLWSEGKGSWHFLTIPPDEAVEIRLESAASGIRRGFGSVRVEASINGVAWKTSIFPQKSGGYILPVKADDTAQHRMHSEWGRIDEATAERLNKVRQSGGRLIAVGTTSLRLIESAADDQGNIQPFDGDTAIFITPGYRFKAVDGLMTNFHLPRSTLFMLVSALMGLEVMRAAYAHAIEQGYRFYSYGDSSLLLPRR